jgi:hypothetical protein
MELWRQTKESKRLKVSNQGNVKKLVDGEWVSLKPRFYKSDYTGAGYLSVSVDRINYRVHRLVANNFVDNPHAKPEVDHISGDRLDNSVGNLKWATRQENMDNAKRNNAFKKGLFKTENTEMEFLTTSTMLLAGRSVKDCSDYTGKDRAQYSHMKNLNTKAKHLTVKLFIELFGGLLQSARRR